VSKDAGGATVVIRIARWRTTASIVVSCLGLAFHALLILWVSRVVGPEFLASLIADPFSIVMLAIPGLAMLLLLGDSIRQYFWGSSLTLNAEGFRIRTPERRRFVRWSDVKQFRVGRPIDSMYPIVGWDHHDDALSGNPI
jgi:hypothetical protein